MIFISAPYTSSTGNKDEEKERYNHVCRYAAKLTKAGNVVQSPILIGHQLLHLENIPGDYTFWKNISITTLLHCDAVHILMLDGWDKSVGVRDEIEHAKLLNMPIEYIAPVV